MRTRPLFADRQERLHHGDQSALREGVDGLGRGFQGGHRVRVAQADAGQHLAAVGTQRLQRGSGVAGETVIELVDQAGQAAAVHRTENQLAVQCAQQQQVVHDVRGGQHTVDGRIGQGDLEPVQQQAAVRHGHRVAADGQGAAGRMVGCDDEVLPAVLQAGVAAPGLRGAGHGVRVFQPDGAQVRVAAGIIIHRGGRGEGVRVTVLLLRWRTGREPGGRVRPAAR